MTKLGEAKNSGRDEPVVLDEPGGTPGKTPYFQQLSLIQIMISVVYFAILSWSAKQLFDPGGFAWLAVFVVWIGLGFCALGLWFVLKMARFAVIGWIFFVIGYMAITLITTNVLAIPTLPVLIGSILFLNLRRHQNNQDALLWVLEVAATRGILLTPGVQAFSGQVTGMFQVWTSALAEFLRQGVPLPDALDTIPRLVPRRSVLLIRMGWESGNLALGLQEAGSNREIRQPILHAIGGRIAYLGWVASVGLFIVGFALYFIIPKFEAIFRDFGVMLPELTIQLIRISHVAVDYSWLGLLAVLAVITYGIVGLLGPGDLTIPVVDRLFARRHTITLLRALAVTVSADRPIPPALSTLAHHYPAAWVRKRLIQAGLDSSQGVDWIEALHENSLISSSDRGVLAAAQRAGNLAWALRELAETSERRWGYRLQAWSQILFVATMLVLGLLVFVIAVAFFMPLVTLIEKLAS